MAENVTVSPVLNNVTVSQVVNTVTVASPGPQGAAGFGASNLNFTFEEQVGATTWNITHNLGYNPSVIVQDYGQNTLEGEVKYLSINTLTITFTSAVSGYAYLS